jgi:hypothetical protein
VRIVLLLWLLCHPALGLSQHPPHETGTERTAPASSQRPANEAPSTLSARPGDPEETGPSSEPGEHNGRSGAEWALVRATWGLVAVTFFLFVYTARLFGATKSLSEEAKATADRQASEVRESLNISRQTVETMDRTAEQQLRAYVFAISGSIEGAFSATGGKVVVVLKNSGQTPAYDCTVRYDTRIVSDAQSCTQDEPARVGQSRGDIAPHEAKRMTIGLRALDAVEKAALKTVGGGAIMYVFGRIEYTDAFKKQRSQGFCYAFGGIFGAADAGGLAEAWHGRDAT